MTINPRMLLVYVAILLNACTSTSDRPTARPDDQPRVPVNRTGASGRPEAMMQQTAKVTSS